MSKRGRRDSEIHLATESSAETGQALGRPALSHSLRPSANITTASSSSIHPTKRLTPDPEQQHHLQQHLQAFIRCALPPHKDPVSFASYEYYEIHYFQTHVNRCSECGKNFPTGHFLNLHIEENHDPLVAARRARGEKTYGCFVEDCPRKCSTAQKRRLHLVDKHMFPRTYNFHIVNDGIDKQMSMLTTRQNQRRSTTSQFTTASTLAFDGRLRRRGLSHDHDDHEMKEEEDQKLMDDEKESCPRTIVQGSDAQHDIAEEEMHHHQQTGFKPPPSQRQPPSRRDIPFATRRDDADIADLERSMSALRFVPPSVTRNRERRVGKEG